MVTDRGTSKYTEKGPPSANLSTWIPTLLRFDLIRTCPVRKWRISAWSMVRHAVCVMNTFLRKSMGMEKAVTLPACILKVSGSTTEFYTGVHFLWFALVRLGKFRDNVMNYLTTTSFPVRKGIIWRHCTVSNSRCRYIVCKQSMICVQYYIANKNFIVPKTTGLGTMNYTIYRIVIFHSSWAICNDLSTKLPLCVFY